MWRRCGTPQNYCLAFIDELEKQLLIKKLLKWANKKYKNFNIYKKKDYFTPVYQKSYSYDLQFLRYRMWQNEIGICGSFLALLPHPTPPHPLILKKWKKLLEISSFYKCVPKSNHIRYGSIDKKWETKFLPFWAIFWTFTPLATRKIKILIKWKKHLEMSLF